MKLLTAILLLTAVTARGQDSCRLRASATEGIDAITGENLRCIARATPKRQLLAMTFASWCAPCRAHLPGAIRFAKENNLDLIIVIPEAEADAYVSDAAAIVRKLDRGIRCVVIADRPYGTRRAAKYKTFLRELIPAGFPVIDDYSKYFLFDKEGQVVFVSSWKDNRGNDWKSDTAVLQQKIRPLLR